MAFTTSVNRYKLDDISHFLNSLAHFPYINGVTSLLSAVYDLTDILIHLCKSQVVLRKIVLKTALSRFLGNALIGIAKLTPLITVAAFIVTCPWLIPLIALVPVIANLIKYTKLSKEWKNIVTQNTLLFNNNPTEETLKNLKDAREALYHTAQERFICFGLILGALLSVVGVFFPPLLIPGIVLSISSALLGFIDKRYQYSKKISHYIFGNFETAEENLVQKNSLIKTLTNQQKIHLNNNVARIQNVPLSQQGLALNQATFFQNKPLKQTQLTQQCSAVAQQRKL